MVHFTCDVCGQELQASSDVRYVVKMEGFPTADAMELTEEDLEEDHLEEISELLDEIEQETGTGPDADVAKSFRFDLCSECYKKFLSNPLGKQTIHRFDFSEN
jgi:hypothetical protein